MTEILIPSLSLLTAFGFGVLFYLHAKGERKRLLEFSKQAFLALRADNVKELSESTAFLEQNVEHIRQAKKVFDKENKAYKPAAPKGDPLDKPTLVDQQTGKIYDVIGV